MIAHLWANGTAPREYVDLQLCRDVYHCTPNELGQIPAATVQAHMVCLAAETKVRAKQRKKAPKAKRK